MNNPHASPLNVDVLIVGSGPIGATFARVLSDRVPDAKILMVELGPQLTERPGEHVVNIADPDERARAQIRSQGPTPYPYAIPSIAERAAAAAQSGPNRTDWLARPGTFLVNPYDLEASDGMPAASLSSNVGGMGAHWTGACPRPGNTERISFIPEDEWDELCTKAEELLSVTIQAYPESVEGFAVQQKLGEVFNARLPEKRKVQPMPLARHVEKDGQLYWTGADTVLGPLAEPTASQTSHFELRSETICRQVLTDGDRVTGALIEHLPSGQREKVAAKVVVVAADALRTPQLLWASRIRPPALGHYLNDQPQVLCAVALSEQTIERERASRLAAEGFGTARRTSTDLTAGVFWVPFHDPEHPFHGQVHLEASPIPVDVMETQAGPQHVALLGWFCRKELRFEDRVEFSDEQTDYLGMPKMIIHYELTATDQKEIARTSKEVMRAVAALGDPINGDEPRMIPPGSSLHYQGTVRMGERNDAQSVCDEYSQVWGWQNLFVGGNGVIPTATACNPTLTSVALAVRACDRIVSLIGC